MFSSETRFYEINLHLSCVLYSKWIISKQMPNIFVFYIHVSSYREKNHHAFKNISHWQFDLYCAADIVDRNRTENDEKWTVPISLFCVVLLFAIISLIVYTGKFVHNLSSKCLVLRKLLRFPCFF